MATTNLLAIHLSLSKRLNDAVTVETADGKKLSATQRDDRINEAIREIQKFIYYKLGKEAAREILQFEVAYDTITFATAGDTLPTDDVGLPLALYSSTVVFSYHPRKEELDLYLNSNLYNAWTISGGKVYAYSGSGTALSTGTGTYVYLKADVGVNNTTDVAVTPRFYDLVVELALANTWLSRGEIAPQECQNMKAMTWGNFLMTGV